MSTLASTIDLLERAKVNAKALDKEWPLCGEFRKGKSIFTQCEGCPVALAAQRRLCRAGALGEVYLAYAQFKDRRLSSSKLLAKVERAIRFLAGLK